MRFLNELIPLRVYPNKRKVFIPVNEKDKKHGAAIFLMAPSQEQNEKMMNASFLYAKKNTYRAYYVDRNVMTYINSGAINDAEEEEFDEVQEAALSEGMIHEDKVKFTFEDGSTMDEQYVKKFYNNDGFKYCCNMLRIKKSPLKQVKVIFHSSVRDLQKSCPEFDRSDKQIYSFTSGDEIHILSTYVYNEKDMDGPYEMYLKNELIYCIIVNQYPEINRKLANCTAMALSGQIKWLRKEKLKGSETFYSKEFRYMDSREKHIDGLYLADIIYELYQTKGSRGIDQLLHGDVGGMMTIIDGRTLRNIKKLIKTVHEDTLTSKERKEMKDSEYGIPSKKKYPMPDASHVKAAIRMFNHCDPADEAELAKNIKKKMKQYGVTAEIGDKNRLSKYISEAAAIEEPEKINGLEYADDGYIFAGEYPEDYYAVLDILKDFSKEEFDRISFNSTYKNSPHIRKRIVLYDPNEVPMAFMDVYHFPSDPERAQITTAVSKFYRGHHLCSMMWKKLLESNFAEENGIKKYIWHVHPGNIASEKIAIAAGFKKPSEKLDKYGRMTYVYKLSDDAESANITLPSVSTESGVMLDESSMIYYGNPDMVLTEDVNSKYDSYLKRYLYKERIRNIKGIMEIYNQIKARNPKIDRTYRNLKMYKGLNLYVDTSYYHEKYIKKAIKGNKRAAYMYFDFLSRLMENEEVFKTYKDITYFFPVYPMRPGQSADEFMDFSTSMNPVSLLTFLIRKDPEIIKRWSNKRFVFIGEKGYFIVNMNDLNMRRLPKFKKNITKLISGAQIVDEDPEEFDPEDDLVENTPKANAARIIDTIEDRTGIEINDISPISHIKLTHLSAEEKVPKLVDEKDDRTAILILGIDSSTVLSDISEKHLASKNIQSYYKPKN